MAKGKKIQGWDRRTCDNCRRNRTHYKVNNKWRCIGTLQKVLDVVAACGDPVKGGVREAV